MKSIRALHARPNGDCSNDSKNINNGPCRPVLDLWTDDTTVASAESPFGGESPSGSNDQNGYVLNEQLILCSSDSELDLNSDDYLVKAFKFIYEIYTPADDSSKDVLQTLSIFERNLALGVSDALGLVNCPDTDTQLSVASSAGPWIRRSLTSLKSNRFLGEDTASSISAVSMMPKDKIVPSTKCASAIPTDEPTSCSHVMGGMTAWINTADGATIPSDDVFLNAVESYIEDDNSKYLGEGLVHVEYIENLDSETLTTLDNANANNATSYAGNTFGLALAGAFFVVAGICGVWFYRKKRNKNEDQEDDKFEKGQVIVKEADDIQLQETEELESPPPSFDLESAQAKSFESTENKLKRVWQMN